MIYQKISKIQEEIGVLSKDAKNPFYKNRYLTLDRIVSNLQPILIKNKVLVTQMPQKEVLTTLVMDLEDESKLESNCQLECPPNDPQKQGSAITYARRYSLGCIFQIQTEEDDDANKTVKRVENLSLTGTDLKTIYSARNKEQLIKVCGDLKKKKGDKYAQIILKEYNSKLKEFDFDDAERVLEAM